MHSMRFVVQRGNASFTEKEFKDITNARNGTRVMSRPHAEFNKSSEFNKNAASVLDSQVVFSRNPQNTDHRKTTSQLIGGGGNGNT